MYLDFEKPIEDLAIEIDKLTLLSEKNKIDVSKAKADLELQKQELTQKIYANLNGWQKVQISRHPNRPYTKDYLNLIFTDFVKISQ